MFLILFKLSIHLARIGLLYSIDQKDLSQILESIGMVDFTTVHNQAKVICSYSPKFEFRTLNRNAPVRPMNLGLSL